MLEGKYFAAARDGAADVIENDQPALPGLNVVSLDDARRRHHPVSPTVRQHELKDAGQFTAVRNEIFHALNDAQRAAPFAFDRGQHLAYPRIAEALHRVGITPSTPNLDQVINNLTAINLGQRIDYSPFVTWWMGHHPFIHRK